MERGEIPSMGHWPPTSFALPHTTCSMSDAPANMTEWLRSLSRAAARSMKDSTSSGTLRMTLMGSVERDGRQHMEHVPQPHPPQRRPRGRLSLIRSPAAHTASFHTHLIAHSAAFFLR